MTMGKRERNVDVELAVQKLISRLDSLIAGDALPSHVPDSVKKVFDSKISSGGSVRLACAFLVAYAVVSDAWDFDSVPVGIRGAYGDKRLSTALTDRHVTFHHAITAFGENLGWKGNVSGVRLSSDKRFAGFAKGLRLLSHQERENLLNHVAWVLFDSRKVPSAIPRLPSSYLSFARACLLCEKLLKINSQGHIQQLLVAGFLSVHRSRLGVSVKTHHPHASDKFDKTVGDIEEFFEGRLLMAYEVTVRDDWKNRLPDLRDKANRGGLSKYVLIASDVNSDKSIFPAEALVAFTAELSFDLAVVDIGEFFRVFCSELTREELVAAFNKAYEYLLDPRISGKHDYVEAYRKQVASWIES